jgi:ribosomal protein S18 acetylase RimI-like enzyme
MENELRYPIRLATEKDIDEMTELHCASFSKEEHVPVMLGKRYVKATYKWLVTSRRSYALVSESDNRIKGLVAVCDGPFTSSLFVACIDEFLLSLARHPALLLKKRLWGRMLRRSGKARGRRNIAEQPGFAQMTIGAVDKYSRGRGIFPDLVRETISVSRSRGSWAIRAGIYKSNQASRRVFIKGGWEEIPELETDDTVFYVYLLDPSLKGRLEGAP